MHTKNKEYSASFEAFDMSKVSKKKKFRRKAVTLWIPEEKKEHYDQFQSETENQFGKDLQDLVIRFIDASVEKNKAG